MVDLHMLLAILAMVPPIVLGAIAYGSLRANVRDNKEELDKVRGKVDAVIMQDKDNGEQIAILNTKVDAMQEDIREIKELCKTKK